MPMGMYAVCSWPGRPGRSAAGILVCPPSSRPATTAKRSGRARVDVHPSDRASGSPQPMRACAAASGAISRSTATPTRTTRPVLAHRGSGAPSPAAVGVSIVARQPNDAQDHGEAGRAGQSTGPAGHRAFARRRRSPGAAHRAGRRSRSRDRSRRHCAARTSDQQHRGRRDTQERTAAASHSSTVARGVGRGKPTALPARAPRSSLSDWRATLTDRLDHQRWSLNSAYAVLILTSMIHAAQRPPPIGGDGLFRVRTAAKYSSTLDHPSRLSPSLRSASRVCSSETWV